MKIMTGVIVFLTAVALTAGAGFAKSHKGNGFYPALQAEALNAEMDSLQVADSADDFPVSASEAASIAQGTVEGARVLKVKLLPSGVYAVTLKADGDVSRVMVDARTGDLL